MRFAFAIALLSGCAYDTPEACELDVTLTGYPGSQETIGFDLGGGESRDLCVALDALQNDEPVTFRAREPFFPHATRLDLSSPDGALLESDDEAGLLEWTVEPHSHTTFTLTTTAIASLRALGIELRLEFLEVR